MYIDLASSADFNTLITGYCYKALKHRAMGNEIERKNFSSPSRSRTLPTPGYVTSEGPGLLTIDKGDSPTTFLLSRSSHTMNYTQNLVISCVRTNLRKFDALRLKIRCLAEGVRHIIPLCQARIRLGIKRVFSPYKGVNTTGSCEPGQVQTKEWRVIPHATLGPHKQGTTAGRHYCTTGSRGTRYRSLLKKVVKQ